MHTHMPNPHSAFAPAIRHLHHTRHRCIQTSRMHTQTQRETRTRTQTQTQVKPPLLHPSARTHTSSPRRPLALAAPSAAGEPPGGELPGGAWALGVEGWSGLPWCCGGEGGLRELFSLLAGVSVTCQLLLLSSFSAMSAEIITHGMLSASNGCPSSV